jgi:electron transfer flavoprotein alpha subunit
MPRPVPQRPPTLSFLGERRSPAGSLDLREAEVIVAGGAGMGSNGLRLLEDLADALGGAVGCTRVAADFGWIPRERQIGQTGKSVSPRLYIACGISGALQHTAGLKGSPTIIAINRDSAAPIFKIADLGIIGDALEVVPALTALVRSKGRAFLAETG